MEDNTMSKRKYCYYIVSGVFCEEQFTEWKKAFTEYARCESATIYGQPNIDGANMEVIMSK